MPRPLTSPTARPRPCRSAVDEDTGPVCGRPRPRTRSRRSRPRSASAARRRRARRAGGAPAPAGAHAAAHSGDPVDEIPAASARISGASGPGPADATHAAPHATAHRRCSAARTQDGPRPAPRLRVCRIEGGAGNPDPSRGGARDRPAGGRDDRAALQDSVGGGGAPPARRRAGPRPDTPANSRRVHDRRRDKCQRAAHTLGMCVPEGPLPRGRSAERAPSTIHGNIRQNEQRLIRPAAASIRSRGPGGCCSRSSRLAQPRHTLSQSSFPGSQAHHLPRQSRASVGLCVIRA